MADKLICKIAAKIEGEVYKIGDEIAVDNKELEIKLMDDGIIGVDNSDEEVGEPDGEGTGNEVGTPDDKKPTKEEIAEIKENIKKIKKDIKKETDESIIAGLKNAIAELEGLL